MLINLREYHRPSAESPGSALGRALELLARPGIRTAPLAGGDTLLASADPAIEAVIDLHGLGLDVIRRVDLPPALHIGAMVTRAALAADEEALALYSGLLAEGARQWSGNVQRNRATVGGAVATGAANDPLVIALLACDAQVVIEAQAGASHVSLADLLPRRDHILRSPALITEVIVPWPAWPCGGASARVARTPADAPIVLAAAALGRAGDRCVSARLALGGVADLPLDLSTAVTPLSGEIVTEETLAACGERVAPLISPASDFLGSAGYRQAMAAVLSVRALREAWRRAA
jgi:CO/xanthine dehydrogenase FAD-binding subunit